MDTEGIDGDAMGNQPTHSVELMNVRHSKSFNTLVGERPRKYLSGHLPHFRRHYEKHSGLCSQSDKTRQFDSISCYQSIVQG